MSDASKQRRIRNYLLEPDLQLRRAYYFVTFFFCMMAGVVILVYVQLIFAVEFLSSEYGLVAVRATDLLKSLSWFTLCGYFTLGLVASILFGIYSSHRVVGPSVAIRHHIDRLKNGDFSRSLSIRKGDELTTVVKALNELTEVLREKYGKK